MTASMRHVLIVEPNGHFQTDLLRAVRGAGYVGQSVGSIEEARARLDSTRYDALVLDVPDAGRVCVIESLREQYPNLAIVATGVHNRAEIAVRAMKAGARDFLNKPFAVDSLESALGAALGPSPAASHESEEPAILTDDPAMKQLLRQTEAAAATEATVQIIGESGTGKDMLARFIHLRSARRAGPFAVVNCAALQESLAESELFGHERGAFTGAVEDREGQVRAADGGTLLLDEIGETRISLQPKMLRMLQEREVQAVGATEPTAVDVRVLVTTQRDLREAVRVGDFREDLYYRIDVIVLEIPPLRERRGDIPLLASRFLDRFAAASGVEPPELGAPTLEALARHPFRGNVRELENLMRRAVVLFPGRPVEPDRLFGRQRIAVEPAPTALSSLNLRELERQAIVQSLAHCEGNRTAASHVLGISVRTLRNKIRLYELS